MTVCAADVYRLNVQQFWMTLIEEKNETVIVKKLL